MNINSGATATLDSPEDFISKELMTMIKQMLFFTITGSIASAIYFL